ncbi:aldehyde dehydrogenase family protein [Variovorax ginsengisoli]|uniref:Aldehyde dehydrogenase family protein n=1 Tax=Variovorax ginsengisoli TaxID=363844 RepID=A0ABT8SF37_9BURK|nr:aldehyde dehydrogenase family protein [Variovorax ginsengisoli]MDN8618339.1 aldehyde dehydrogenase family protein [Variovorax ginsengisoli]MDO1537509.1 aldehyde dehydrogenase family protein [Variovorax ginsengisoli]
MKRSSSRRFISNQKPLRYAQGDAAQVDAAVAAATAAFPAWSTGGIQARSEALDKIGNEILARKEELGTLLAREEGKTKAEGIGEATRAAQIFKFFAGECLRLSGEVLPSVRPGIGIEITREPVGVVGLITPWNFPIAIPAWKIAPALAFGNCVVMKPADLVPGCAWALAEIISRSGIAPGVFNLVMGRGSVIGDALVNHPGIHAISFTGSVGVGRNIAVQCATNHKKVQLEMGGKNPQVVLDDADLNQAVELSVQSAFYSTGQRCTASSRLIVTEGIYPKFIEAMKARMAKIKVGDALAQGTDIGPGASVVRVKNYEEALATANDTEFGLSARIATTSLKYATHFKRHSQAGMVMVNLPTAGVDYHVPFGGRKGSSYRPREQGRYAQEFFTAVKTAYTLT